MDKYGVLKQYFGHTAFRDGQEALIDAILNGCDAFGIMPTGGGKSLCYQIPALMMDGVALVVSPLISLMKDQVMALKSAGVDAAYINSSLPAEQMRAVCRNMRTGKYKIVYVAPERLGLEGFITLAQSLPIALVAVDEAHCISQWGQDFRPSYLRIVEFLEKLPRRPVLAAFTATATQQVREDIVRILKMRDPKCVVTGFDRPNLNFEVLRPKNRVATLHALINQRRGKSGIIYCATRNNVEKLCEELRANGVPATRYHAGLADAERRQNQEDFLYDHCPVMVATNAFGMGIDKSNVSYVIHYNMPKSLEAYYQEAGRAGRDGEKADCILLYSSADIQTAKFLIQNAEGNEELSEEERQIVIAQDIKRLNTMISYCKTTECLRGYILEYFGQGHARRCESCGNCRTVYCQKDMTREAQMVLSCVKRAYDKLGYSVGMTLIIRTLCGSKDQRVRELGLDQLSTYGLMREISRPQVREYMELLESEGYLHTNTEHGGVELTAKAGDVLFRGETVTMTTSVQPSAPQKPKSKKKAVARAEQENDLFAALKSLRFQIAQRERVPAYIIFSNATLADMAEKIPTSMEEFLEVSGVGEVKAARYGEEFLEQIIKYENNGRA